MSVAEELQVSVSAVVEAEEVDDPLVPVGEDELENLEPENEGVVFVITTGQSRRQSRKSNKTNQSESRCPLVPANTALVLKLVCDSGH